MSKQKPGQKPQSKPQRPTPPPRPQSDPSIITTIKKGDDKPDIQRPQKPEIERK